MANRKWRCASGALQWQICTLRHGDNSRFCTQSAQWNGLRTDH